MVVFLQLLLLGDNPLNPIQYECSGPPTALVFKLTVLFCPSQYDSASRHDFLFNETKQIIDSLRSMRRQQVDGHSQNFITRIKAYYMRLSL